MKTPELRFKRNAQSFSHGWELPALLSGSALRSSVERFPRCAYKPGSGGQLIAFVPSLDLVITRADRRERRLAVRGVLATSLPGGHRRRIRERSRHRGNVSRFAGYRVPLLPSLPLAPWRAGGSNEIEIRPAPAK